MEQHRDLRRNPSKYETKNAKERDISLRKEGVYVVIYMGFQY